MTALVGVMALAWVVAAPAVGLATEQAQSNWLDQALAARGLENGWADYWRARPLRLLSSRGTVTVPVCTLPDAAPQFYPWMACLDPLSMGEVLSRPQFVVTNGLGEAELNQALGPPWEVLEGEGLKVLIYAKVRGLYK